MLSIARTKELVGDPAMTDSDAEKLRDEFRALAEIAFEQWQVLRPLNRGDP
jgi:hypothetical protein